MHTGMWSSQERAALMLHLWWNCRPAGRAQISNQASGKQCLSVVHSSAERALFAAVLLAGSCCDLKVKSG
eukprot:1160064-Pelagomonas_calceolata.AAC.9